MSSYSSLFNLIVWVPTVVVIIILIWQLLSGMRRGLSKSLKLFITFVLSILIAIACFTYAKHQDYDSLIVTYGNQILSNHGSSFTALMNNIGSNFNWTTVTDHTKLTEYFEEILSSSNYFQATAQGLSLADAAKLLYSMSSVLINLVLFVLCIIIFFIAKAILYLFYLMFAREGRRKKKIENKYNAELSNKKYKKRKLGGSIVGLVRGIIVSIFVAGIFGTISLLVPSNKDNEVSDTSNVSEDAYVYVDMLNAISRWSDSGITSLLNSLKNSENLPYYLILSDKILTTDYTYVENGESKTITLHLASDIAPLSGAFTKSAYVLLMYGYDPSYNYTTEELNNFLSSDKLIDGLTLQDRIDNILKECNTGEYSSYLLNSLVVSYVSKVCNGASDETSSEYKSLSLSNKLLYQIFLGNNKLKITDITNDGNLAQVFNIYIDILKHQDEINAIKDVFNKIEETENQSQKLLFGIRSNAIESNAQESKNLFNTLNDRFKSFTFYNTNKFQKLLSDCFKTIIEEQFEDLDFTSVVSNDTIYDINWSESIDTVFNVLGDCVDLIVENKFTKTEELTDYLVDQLSNSKSKTVTDLISLADCSAGAIILNSKAFNKIANDSITKMFSSILPNNNISLIETNYSTYTKEDGTVVDGELKKIITSIGPSISSIYKISKNDELSNDLKIDKMIYAISSDEALRELIDTTKSNHSNLVHSILSNVITNITFTYNEESKTLYVPSTSLESINLINSTTNVIESSEFINVLDFLKTFSSKYSTSNLNLESTDTLVDMMLDLSQSLKNSDIICANIARVVYSMKDSANISIPSTLIIDDSHLESNINNWLGEDGETCKLLNIITFEYVKEDGTKGSYISLIKELLNNGSSDYSSYLVKVMNASNDYSTTLFTSDVINATITQTLKNEENIYISSSSYNVLNETLKIEEIKSLLHFAKEALNISESSESIDLNNLNSLINLSKYSNDLDGLLALFDSDIVSATMAYNVIKNGNSDSNNLVIPNKLVFTKEDETNLSNWLNDKEIKSLVTSIYDLDLLSSLSSDTISLNEDKLLTLEDDKIYEVFKSDVFHATGVNYFEETRPSSLAIRNDYIISKEDIINNYDNLTFVKNNEMPKLIIGVKKLGISLSNSVITVTLINKMNNTDSNNVKTIDYIIQSDVLDYALSNYIISSEYLNISSNSIDIKDNYKYITNTETKALVSAIINLNINDLSSFDSNKLLTSNLEVLLQSNIIYYTISHKLLDLSNITILEDSIYKNDSEIYINKLEIQNFIESVKCVTNDINNISVSASNFLTNSATFLQSAIIRNSITDEILKSNDLVINRVNRSNESDNTTYTNSYYVYTNNGATNSKKYQVSKQELTYFVSALNKIFIDSSTATYEIDYNSINLNTIDSSIFKSSIIVNGLQTKIKLAISSYNVTVGENGNMFDDDSYNIYDYQILDHSTNEISKPNVYRSSECAIDFVDNYLTK